MVTCDECIHERVCVIISFPEAFENTQWSKKPCDHFINKNDIKEVNHGEWNIIEFDKIRQIVVVECSECNGVFKLKMPEYGLSYNCCPSCGAKMDGGVENV